MLLQILDFPYTLKNMEVFAILAYSSALVSLGFGIYAITQYPLRYQMGRMFLYLSILFSVWSFGTGFFYIAGSEESAVFWYKFGIFGLIISAPTCSTFFFTSQAMFSRASGAYSSSSSMFLPLYSSP
jgi:uncharacterized membrane protein YbaN (DUF454 family)